MSWAIVAASFITTPIFLSFYYRAYRQALRLSTISRRHDAFTMYHDAERFRRLRAIKMAFEPLPRLRFNYFLSPHHDTGALCARCRLFVRRQHTPGAALFIFYRQHATEQPRVATS